MEIQKNVNLRKMPFLISHQLFLKKYHNFKRIMKLSVSVNKNLNNIEIISVLKNNVTINIMNDPSIQKLLKDSNYINFELILRFSKEDLKSEMVDFKKINNTKGLIRLLNNENSLYHILCRSILQIKNKTLTCTQVETSYQDHHIMPLHLDSTGLIQKQELDRDYNIIRIPIEFHYFLHAIRAVEYDSSKDFLTTHLHFSRLIKSVNQDLYKNIDFSYIYTEDQVNQKFFIDILKNYSVFSLKTTDFSTEEGLEKSIVSRQTDRTIELLNNDTYWINNDIPLTKIDYHLIPAKKYTISSQLFDELIDLMLENQKPLKNKNNYQSFTRYINLSVKKPPFGWECIQVETIRNKISQDLENRTRRSTTNPRVLTILDCGGYYWENKDLNYTLSIKPKYFKRTYEIVVELFKLSNISESKLTNSDNSKGETTRIASIMAGDKKAATQFYNWYLFPDSTLGLTRLPDTKTDLSLKKISNILVFYNDKDKFIVDLHDQFKSLLNTHAQSINILSESTIQMEICNFRESMYTRFKNTNTEFLKTSKSVYFRMCYYCQQFIVFDQTQRPIDQTQRPKNSNLSFSYSIMPNFMENVLPMNFQIYRNCLNNKNNQFLTTLGMGYVLQILRFLEFGFSHDFEEILTFYPLIPPLKSFLKSRSDLQLPLDFGLKFNNYQNDRGFLVKQLIEYQIAFISLFNNLVVDPFSWTGSNIQTNEQRDIGKQIRENFFNQELIWINDQAVDTDLSIKIPPYILTRVYDLIRILIAHYYPKEKQETNKWSNADLLQKYSQYMLNYLLRKQNYNSPFDGWKLKDFLDGKKKYIKN